MKLKDMLLADLARQHYFDGTPERLPTILGVWKRALHPRFAPVVLFRLAYSLNRRRLTPLARMVSLLNFVLFGIEIALNCDIGGGLFLPHTVGTVIGARSIGSNALIFQGVTLGAKEIDIGYHAELRPTLGDNVTIGAGAKVLGGIFLGNNVVVGANAVVVKSLPSNSVAGGIPATVLRVILENEENPGTRNASDETN